MSRLILLFTMFSDQISQQDLNHEKLTIMLVPRDT